MIPMSKSIILIVEMHIKLFIWSRNYHQPRSQVSENRLYRKWNDAQRQMFNDLDEGNCLKLQLFQFHVFLCEISFVYLHFQVIFTVILYRILQRLRDCILNIGENYINRLLESSLLAIQPRYELHASTS
jgi:hypothetical protein